MLLGATEKSNDVKDCRPDEQRTVYGAPPAFFPPLADARVASFVASAHSSAPHGRPPQTLPTSACQNRFHSVYRITSGSVHDFILSVVDLAMFSNHAWPNRGPHKRADVSNFPTGII